LTAQKTFRYCQARHLQVEIRFLQQGVGHPRAIRGRPLTAVPGETRIAADGQPIAASIGQWMGLARPSTAWPAVSHLRCSGAIGEHERTSALYLVTGRDPLGPPRRRAMRRQVQNWVWIGALCLVLALAWTASAAAAESTLDQVLKRGKLLVGIGLGAPPFGMYDATRNPPDSTWTLPSLSLRN